MQNHVLEPCVLELLTTCFGILKRKYIKKISKLCKIMSLSLVSRVTDKML